MRETGSKVVLAYRLLPEIIPTTRGLQKLTGFCRCKASVEDEGHIVCGVCSVYGGLRTQFGDLGEDQNLVAFFTAVLDRRDELEEDDRTRQS